MKSPLRPRIAFVVLPILVATGIACDGGGSHDPATTGSNAVTAVTAAVKSAASSGPPTVPANTILADTSGVLAPPGDGALRVDDSGTTHEHLAIWVPPGRAGMQPELSLEYSSSGGDGLVGVGWGLAGLSRITRCKGLRQNGAVAPPVLWSESDSFCLDGEPLVADTDHMHYRRFHDDGSLIVRTHQYGDGDASSWTMSLKNGRVVTFGATPDSRVTVSRDLYPSGTTKTMTFAVSRVQDRAGNFMTVTYQPSAGGDILPKEIDYTGSASSPTTLRSLTFGYGTGRPDVAQRIFAEQPFTYPERLSTIQMHAPNSAGMTTLRSFNLVYTTSPTTGRSILSSIAECAGAPTLPVTGSTPLCRQESFTYAPGTPLTATNAFGVDSVDTNGQLIADVEQFTVEGIEPMIRLLDVDADGRDDLLYIKNDGSEHYALRMSTGGAFGPAIDTGIAVSASKNLPSPVFGTAAPIVLDFNGDGHADILVNQGPETAPVTTLYLANDASGSWQLGGAGYQLSLSSAYAYYQSADLNGDALPDLLMMQGSTAYYQINRDGTLADLSPPTAMPTQTSASYQSVLTNYYLDLNGDGVTDVMTKFWADNACVGQKIQTNCDCRKMGYGALDVGANLYSGYGSTATGFTTSDVAGLTVCTGVVAGELTMYTPLFGDFNGDGLVDVIQTDVPADSSQSYPPMTLALSLGGGLQSFIGQPAAGTFQLANTNVAFTTLDADLDGATDLVVRGNGSLTPYTVYSWKSGAWKSTVVPLAENLPEYGNQMLVTGDVNGDGLQDIVAWAGQGNDATGQINVYTRNSVRPDVLIGVKGDFGPTASVTYKPYLAATTEDRSDCAAPLACVTRGGWLASEVDTDNGIGGTNALRHAYASGRADEVGWGFLGYKTHTITDVTTGAVTTRSFDFSQVATGPTPFYPFLGLPDEVDTTIAYQSGGQSVTRTTTSSTTYTVQGTGPFMALPSVIESQTTDSNVSTPIASKTAQFGYDAYGNMTSEQDYYPIDSESRTKSITYLNDTTNWIIGRPTYVSETSTVSTGVSTTRVTAYTYDSLGQLAVQIDNPGAANASGSYDPLPTPQQDGVQTLYTRTTRDGNGMPTLVEKLDNLSAPTQDRATATVYDASEGMFVIQTTDPANLVTQSAYEPGLGVLAAQTDAAGVLTTYQYDTFGRIRADHPAAGGDRSVAYHAATSGNFGSTEDHRLGQYDTTSYLDSLRRVVSTTVTGRADGKSVSSETTYDALGRVTTTTRPHFAGAKGAPTITTYDNLGRVTQTTGADGSVQATAYLGRQVTTTNPDGNMSVVTNDSLGRPVTSVQATTAGSSGLSGHVTTTTLGYGPFDMLITEKDTLGNVVTTTYDRVGRRIIENNRDSNATGYTYDVFGELTDELRGAQEVSVFFGGHVRVVLSGGTDNSMTYDGDGRVLTKSAPDVTQTFTYDTAYPGKLATETLSAGTSIAYTYDGFGNVHTKAWNGPRGAIGYTYTYDKYNRPSTTTYPAFPAVTNQPALVVQNAYSGGDLGGELVAVNDVTNPKTPTAYWTLKSTDATETFSVTDLRNGVETTLTEDPSHPSWLQKVTSKVGTTTVQALNYVRAGAGRVAERDDTLNKITEKFGYDGLERLTSWSWTGSVGARGAQYVYDDIGNLQQRNVTAGPGTSVTYGYGGADFGPHQVASDGGTTQFAYDPTGNQLVAPGRSFTYDSFDRVTSVTAAAGTYTMTYDGDLARFSRTDPAGEAHYSYGGMFEEFTDAAGTHYVMKVAAAGHPVAEVEKLVTNNALKSTTVNAILVDALGSVDALVGSNGKPLAIKYDPYGARVQVSDPTVHVTTAPDDLRAGFTGHDHDDDVDLIDMIGRVYDPVQQRFLSVDPPAPNPVDGQAYNPYAYVRNNPLNATDPTGYLEVLLDGQHWGVNDNLAYGSAGYLTSDQTTYVLPYGALPGETQGMTGTDGPGVFNLGNWASKLSVDWQTVAPTQESSHASDSLEGLLFAANDLPPDPSTPKSDTSPGRASVPDSRDVRIDYESFTLSTPIGPLGLTLAKDGSVILTVPNLMGSDTVKSLAVGENMLAQFGLKGAAANVLRGGLGFSATYGTLLTTDGSEASPAAVLAFLTGTTASLSGGFILGAGLAMNSSGLALERGLTTPSLSLGLSYGIRLFNINDLHADYSYAAQHPSMAFPDPSGPY